MNAKDKDIRNGKGTEQAKDGAAQAEDWLIPEDGRQYLRDLFGKLKNPVAIKVFSPEGEPGPYTEFMVKFARDLDRLGDKITASFHTVGDAQAAKYEVDVPSVLISPDEYHMRFLGAPMGEEARAFIEGIMFASLGVSGLSGQSKKLLADFDEERLIQVFVSPTCPYCPGQIINAFKAAVEKPSLIKAEAVVTVENEDLAMKYGVGSVPHTVINDTHNMLGLMPEERFVLEMILLQDAEETQDGHGHAHGHALDSGAPGGAQVIETDLVVAGAGPAGLTAGIYGERSGMRTVILEKGVIGGQVALTPVVENYPGFANVAGAKLMEIMSQHAREYCTINEGEDIAEVKVGKNIEVITGRGVYVAKALIIATGATWRKLGAMGEDRYFGLGVNYCATCDGYLYKGRKVAVVGGGNTALTDALHLRNLGVDVTVIHRRDAFRAERHLQDSLEREGVPVLWNKEVLEIQGDELRVNNLRLVDTVTGEESDFAVNGVFVAIGHDANNALARQLGLAMDQGGFIKVDAQMRTSIPRIYAAGDVTGGVQQIVTAVGEGSAAALAAFEDTAHPYWKK
ncbi:MAG: FAD-dependent oxidoreductase [Desulfovibrionaceae bacterium]